MIFAVGKSEGHDKKVLVYAAFPDRVVGVESSSFLSEFTAEIAGALASHGAEMAAEKLFDNLPGGGLLSGLTADLVEDKVISKVEGMLSANLDGKTDEELAAVFQEGDILIDVPREKISRVQMKTKGIMKKRFHVTFKEKGFWIFNTTHKLTFSPSQQANAESVFGAL
jgi:hypothetical protein